MLGLHEKWKSICLMYWNKILTVCGALCALITEVKANHLCLQLCPYFIVKHTTHSSLNSGLGKISVRENTVDYLFDITNICDISEISIYRATLVWNLLQTSCTQANSIQMPQSFHKIYKVASILWFQLPLTS